MALHRNIGQLFFPGSDGITSRMGEVNVPEMVNNYVEGFIRNAKDGTIITAATIQMFYTPSGEAITDKLTLDSGTYNAWIDVYDPKLVELRFTAKGFTDRSLLFSEAQATPDIFMTPGTKSSVLWVALAAAGVAVYAANQHNRK